MQIAADALGMPVHLLEGHPGSCLGAAYLAAMGIGAGRGWDGIARFTRPAATLEPDRATSERYDAVYRLYRDVYCALESSYPRLAALTSP